MKPQLKLIIGLQKERRRQNMPGKKEKKEGSRMKKFFGMEKVLLSLFWQQYYSGLCKCWKITHFKCWNLERTRNDIYINQEAESMNVKGHNYPHLQTFYILFQT